MCTVSQTDSYLTSDQEVASNIFALIKIMNLTLLKVIPFLFAGWSRKAD